jgi:hypothetical protein
MTNAQARWYLPAMAGFTSRDTWTLPPVRSPRPTATCTPTAPR